MKHPLLAAAAANRLHGPTKKQRKATGGGGSRPAAPRAGMQLYLDFGQRSFGRQITCPECGLMYTEGEPNDEAGHRAHHERALRGAPMRECESESVACRLPDGSRICVVDVASAEPQLRRAREAATLMARDFGEFEFPPDYRAFLAIGADARLRGVAVAHPIRSAHRAMRVSDGSSGGGGSRDVVRCGEEAVPASCGVSHIWVLPAHRRRGLGSHLLDAVRRHMALAFEVGREGLAFCQPTEAGRALAASYVGQAGLGGRAMAVKGPPSPPSRPWAPEDPLACPCRSAASSCWWPRAAPRRLGSPSSADRRDRTQSYPRIGAVTSHGLLQRQRGPTAHTPRVHALHWTSEGQGLDQAVGRDSR